MQQYNEYLLNFFHNTKHQGKLDTANKNVFAASAGTSDNQDVLQLFLRIENDIILEARFLAKGSVAIIAAGEWLCEYIVLTDIKNLDAFNIEFVLQKLELSTLKIHVAQLVVTVLKTCVDTYLNG